MLFPYNYNRTYCLYICAITGELFSSANKSPRSPESLGRSFQSIFNTTRFGLSSDNLRHEWNFITYTINDIREVDIRCASSVSHRHLQIATIIMALQDPSFGVQPVLVRALSLFHSSFIRRYGSTFTSSLIVVERTKFRLENISLTYK